MVKEAVLAGYERYLSKEPDTGSGYLIAGYKK